VSRGAVPEAVPQAASCRMLAQGHQGWEQEAADVVKVAGDVSGRRPAQQGFVCGVELCSPAHGSHTRFSLLGVLPEPMRQQRAHLLPAATLLLAAAATVAAGTRVVHVVQGEAAAAPPAAPPRPPGPPPPVRRAVQSANLTGPIPVRGVRLPACRGSVLAVVGPLPGSNHIRMWGRPVGRGMLTDYTAG